MSYTLFIRWAYELRPIIERNNTKFRKALPAEIKLAGVLLYAGGTAAKRATRQLWIGTSTVSVVVKV